MISLEKRFDTFTKMWEIWANQLLPKDLKSCPKSNKSPNLVTLIASKARLNPKLRRLSEGLCVSMETINKSAVVVCSPSTYSDDQSSNLSRVLQVILSNDVCKERR